MTLELGVWRIPAITLGIALRAQTIGITIVVELLGNIPGTMGKEIWMWKHFGKCEIENPTNRGAFSCLLNRIVDSLFSKKAIYQMLVSVQSCFNSRNTRYYNNVMATADHVTVESIRHLQPVKFGPLTVTAPDDLEGFLRYNYPTLHRFTKEEQEKINNHYPAALSFSTTPKQEL